MRRILIVATVLVGGFLVSVAPAETTGVPTAPAVVQLPLDSTEPVASRAGRQRWQVKVRGWSKPISRGGQATINRCKATLFWGSLPGNSDQPAWLAGHDRCGFWRWDKWLPIGSKITVTTPKGKVLKYRVYARDVINRKSGSSDGLIHGDLTLQTCRGAKMTFAYARRQG